MAGGLKLAVTLVYGRICDIYFYFSSANLFENRCKPTSSTTDSTSTSRSGLSPKNTFLSLIFPRPTSNPARHDRSSVADPPSATQRKHPLQHLPLASVLDPIVPSFHSTFKVVNTSHQGHQQPTQLFRHQGLQLAGHPQ